VDKRREGESFEDYKARLRMQNEVIDEYLKGVMFWPSHISGTFWRYKDSPKITPVRREYKI